MFEYLILGVLNTRNLNEPKNNQCWLFLIFQIDESISLRDTYVKELINNTKNFVYKEYVGVEQGGAAGSGVGMSFISRVQVRSVWL